MRGPDAIELVRGDCAGVLGGLEAMRGVSVGMHGHHRRAVSGQMAVELAVLMPVVIVVALIVYNLGRFVCLCATFDRVAADAIVSQGVSPSGEQTRSAAEEAVRACIEDALDAPDTCMVEVDAEPASRSGGDGLLSMTGLLTRFRCRLLYRPWPSSRTFAGVPYEAPLVLRHECTLVVDRYRPGVVV